MCKKYKKELKVLLKKAKTMPVMERTITDILIKLRTKKTINPNDYPNIRGLRAAVKDQVKIGWNNFVLGRWSKKWQRVQQRYIRDTGNRQSSLQWTSTIIHKLLLIAWDMWQYINSVLHDPAGVNAQAQH